MARSWRAPITAAVLLCLALACQNRRAGAPDWIQGAPADTVAAVSCATGWALAGTHCQTLQQACPQAGRALAVLLERARFDPGGSGRITLYLGGAAPGPNGQWLIQLGGLKDPGKVQAAIADAFPVQGALAMDNRGLPLFTVLDLEASPVRAVADEAGRIWLGLPAALDRLDQRRLGSEAGLAGCAEWISRKAAVQGFIRPQAPPGDADRRQGADTARQLPQGIEALAWGVSPGPSGDALHGFELAMAGGRQAIRQAAPWLQDFVAAAQAVPGAPGQLPEILQERRRIALRWRLTQAQLNVVLARLGQPAVPCS